MSQLKGVKPQRLCARSALCQNSPRRVVLLVSLHHVAEARIGQCLRKVGVRRHEAVVVKAWTQAGRAQAEGLSLGTAGSTQHSLVLGRQVGAKQGLQQLQRRVLLSISSGNLPKMAM